jgi:prostaglandin-H2 D-isomerase / glutathione transferase
MPSEQQIGTPSAANDQLGGIPRVHYFDNLSRGRGQVIRLFLIDAGAAFVDLRYTYDEFYRDFQPSWMAKGGLNPTGKMPVIQLNSKVYTQTYPTFRYWSRLLGNAYDGDTLEETYQVDRLNDIGVDYRNSFVNASKYSSPEGYAKYKTDARPVILASLERHLEESPYSSRGPFVIGSKFTYADMVM